MTSRGAPEEKLQRLEAGETPPIGGEATHRLAPALIASAGWAEWAPARKPAWRLAIVENEMRNKRLDERDKARKLQSYRTAVANEHTAKLVPINRSEDPGTARALRELRRDLKAWESAAEDEAA